MPGFKYAMQNILNIKEKVEEQKRMELGLAMAAYQRELDAQHHIESTLGESIQVFVEAQKNTLPVSEFIRMNNSVNFYENALKEQKIQVHKTLEVVNKRREALRKALEEKQIQEKLKEKAYEVFVEEEKMKEQKILDEVVSYRYSTDSED